MALAGRKPNKEERDWLDVITQLGCIACRVKLGITDSPAEVHHIDGKTKPGAHLLTLPLCPRHHRLPGPGYVSRADGKKLFEAEYGTELELHSKVVDLVAEHRGYQEAVFLE